MSKPATVLHWADDANYPAGSEPEHGTPTKSDPGRADIGYRPLEHPTAQELGWLFNLIGLWIQWLNLLFGADGSLTLDNNASVKITGDGRYKHGKITTFIPACAGSEPTNLSGTFDSIQGDGIINITGTTWQIPISLPMYERITAVRALVRDNVTGTTKLKMELTGIVAGIGGGAAFTVNPATDVCTNTGGTHNWATGDGPFQVETDNTLPGGLVVLTNYWVIRVGTDTFKLATSFANAIAGTAVDITSVGVAQSRITKQMGLDVTAASAGDGTDQILETTGSWHMHGGSGVAGNANSFNRFVGANIFKFSGSGDVRIYGIEVDHDMLD